MGIHGSNQIWILYTALKRMHCNTVAALQQISVQELRGDEDEFIVKENGNKPNYTHSHSDCQTHMFSSTTVCVSKQSVL